MYVYVSVRATNMSQKNINFTAYKSDYSIYFFLLVSNSYV